jgi:hypothetical protein
VLTGRQNFSFLASQSKALTSQSSPPASHSSFLQNFALFSLHLSIKSIKQKTDAPGAINTERALTKIT